MRPAYVVSISPTTASRTGKLGDICIYSRGPDKNGKFTPGISGTSHGGVVGRCAGRGRFGGH